MKVFIFFFNFRDNKCENYDSALIDNKWSGTRQMVHIKIYGFRFVDSQDVTINCSALVCPDSNNCQKVGFSELFWIQIHDI